MTIAAGKHGGGTFAGLVEKGKMGLGPTNWPVEDTITLNDCNGDPWTRPRSVADHPVARLLGRIVTLPLAVEFVEKHYYWLLSAVPLVIRHFFARLCIKLLVIVHRLFR